MNKKHRFQSNTLNDLRKIWLVFLGFSLRFFHYVFCAFATTNEPINFSVPYRRCYHTHYVRLYVLYLLKFTTQRAGIVLWNVCLVQLLLMKQFFLAFTLFTNFLNCSFFYGYLLHLWVSSVFMAKNLQQQLIIFSLSFIFKLRQTYKSPREMRQHQLYFFTSYYFPGCNFMASQFFLKKNVCLLNLWSLIKIGIVVKVCNDHTSLWGISLGLEL